MPHDLGRHPLFKLTHCSDVVTALGTVDDRVIIHATNDREVVLTAYGTVEFDAHRSPPSESQLRD